MPKSDSVVAAAKELRRRCLADPLYFGPTILGYRRWKRQEEMRLAVEKHRYVHLCSANGVGKSHELAAIAIEFVMMHKHSRVMVSGPSFDAARDGLWAKIVTAIQGARVPLGGRLTNSKSECAWRLGSEWEIRVVNPDKPDAIQGQRGSRVLVMLDEAHSVEPAFWSPFQSLLTANASRMIVSGNPLYNTGPFRDAAHSPLWHKIQISGLEHPNVVEGRELIPGAITREWIAERLIEFGSEDDPRYVARVLGQFPAGASMRQVVALKWLQDCASITPEIPPEPRRMGVDLARQGGDANVIAIFDERRRLIVLKKWYSDDTEPTVAWIMETAREYQVLPENVRLDGCGMGGPIVDRLRGLGWNVESVDFGASPEYEWIETTGETTEFTNRRSELYWVARELLRKRLISIPEKFGEAWLELTGVERKPEPADRGRIKLEAKEEVRKRIGRSPDSADAIVIALSNVGCSLAEPKWI